MSGVVKSFVSVLAHWFGRLQRRPEVLPAFPKAVCQPDQTQKYTLFLLPIWVLAGVADYLWHRKTRIETTSGTEESITHALMITEMAPAVLAALFLEINAGVLALIIASYLAHEATVAWDIYFTASRRPIPPGEQHTHSYLQGVPFCLASFVVFTHWEVLLSLFGKGSQRPRFNINLKQPALPPGYLLPVLLGSGLLAAVPHAEELWRCWKAERAGLTGRDTPECTRELFGPSNDRF
jgi:hypothetical protein